jgi:hypothetical protein
MAQSTDATGNTAESRGETFETLPLADEVDPTVSPLDPGVCRETVTISAEASDDTGTEKVEFYLGEELLFIDYSPPYAFIMDTYDYENAQYTLKAKAYDLSGRSCMDERIITIANATDVTAPSVNIYHPPDGTTVSGKTKVLVLVQDDSGVSCHLQKYLSQNLRN